MLQKVIFDMLLAIILTSRPLSELRLDVAIISDVQHAYSVVLMPER